MTKKSKAILFIIIAYLSIALMSVFAKVATVSLPSTEVLFARFSIGLIFLLPILYNAKSFTFKISSIKMSLLRNLSGLASMLLLFYSLKYISVSTSVLLMNTTSLFVPLLLLILFRQKTSFSVLICTFIGFLGVVIVISPTAGDSIVYLLIGLISAILAALAEIGIKKLSEYDSPLQIVFYFYLMSTAIIPVFTSYDWQLPTAYEFFLLSMVGIFGLFFQIFMSYALKYANITVINPFVFTGVIFASILGWGIWGDVPTVTFWIGGFIIIIAVSILVRLRNI